jgi:WD40 repeat protein
MTTSPNIAETNIVQENRISPNSHASAIQESRILSGHNGYIGALAFSTDGKYLISGGYDDTSHLWNAATGESLQVFQGHTSWIRSVDITQDNRRVLTGGLDGTVRIWDFQTGQELLCFKEHQSSIQAVAFSPDGQRVLSGSEDGVLRIWDAQTGGDVKILGEHMTGVICTSFSSKGHLAVAGIGKGMVVWDMNSESQIQRMDARTRLQHVFFSADGRSLVCSADDGSVSLWNIESGKQQRLFVGYNRWVHTAALSPDGRFLFGGYDAIVADAFNVVVRRWNIENEREYQDFFFVGHTQTVATVVFAPNGQEVASSSQDKTVRLWQLPN